MCWTFSLSDMLMLFFLLLLPFLLQLTPLQTKALQETNSEINDRFLFYLKYSYNRGKLVSTQLCST